VSTDVQGIGIGRIRRVSPGRTAVRSRHRPGNRPAQTAQSAVEQPLGARRQLSRLAHTFQFIDVPDELAAMLRRTPEELQYDLRLRALAGLVERGLISTGRAAELAGVSRREFLDWCGRWHVRVHRWDQRELDTDLAFARAGTSA
jgi:predicted HTH domain antitoxin